MITRPIDRRIEKLVDVLNTVPGITTFSSCGGHEKPNKFQRRYPKWVVGFAIDPYSKIASAFKVLLKAEILWQFYGAGFTKGHGVEIKPWWNGCVDFEVEGRDEPDQFAGWIEKVLKGEKLPDGY